MKKWFVLPGLLGVVLNPTIALSENVVIRDLSDRVFITGVEPYGKYTFVSPDSHPTRNVSANACGFVKITPTDSYPIHHSHTLMINGGDVGTVSSLPILPAAQCKDGSIANESAITATTWRDSNGAVYQKGLTPYTSYEVEYSSVSSVRKVTANACGHITVPAANGDIIQGTYTFTSVDLSTLTPTLAVPICSKGISYLPESLFGGSGGSGGSGS